MDKKCRSGAAGIKLSLIQNMGKTVFSKKDCLPHVLNMRVQARIFLPPHEIFSKKECCH
jgi:hypothetical protein